MLRNPIFLPRISTEKTYRRVTVSALPDDVLLEIFDLYVDSAAEYEAPDAWHSLIHVCQRWRCVVFASPRRLRLRLLCTPKRPVKMMLDVWPESPIVISAYMYSRKGQVTV